jgi:excinuclease ABC subunit C
MSSHFRKIKNLPSAPGVYLMRNVKGSVIYIGRATSLKARVSSYWHKAHDAKTERLVSEIAKLDCIATDSILEATILEAQLIKKYQPKYNIKQKDDRSFLYVAVTRDAFPKILIIREHQLKKQKTNTYQAIFGPFVSFYLTQSILKLIRKMFPWSNCQPNQKKPCFYYHLHQCPGVCTGEVSAKDYQKIIRNLILFFQGKKKRVIKNLKKEMNKLSVQEKFEEAAKLRNQLYYLEHIQDIGLVTKDAPLPVFTFSRIEGYDISNISGRYAGGSMVVFENAQAEKSQYRYFKIKTVFGANDVAMLREVIKRRFRHKEWPSPDLVLIDGGKPQVNTVATALKSINLTIPIVGIAKGPGRKKIELVFGPTAIKTKKIIIQYQNLLTQIRDEAHRFALKYHRKLRNACLY